MKDEIKKRNNSKNKNLTYQTLESSQPKLIY